MTATPAEALSQHHELVRRLAVEVVQERTRRMVEAGALASSRFGMGFASQWRDLLADMAEALQDYGFPAERLLPAGYEVPVVNGCLVYVWRNASDRNKSTFAESRTRRGGLSLIPDSQLRLEYEDDVEAEAVSIAELNGLVADAPPTMPFVLIRVESSERELSRISWAIATLKPDGSTTFNHEEAIWTPVAANAPTTVAVVAFDSGVPARPMIEPRPAEGPLDGE